MGYFSADAREVVVTQAIGPGPNAFHQAYGFSPDYFFQDDEISRIYEESHRTQIYLGDWHTHPRDLDGKLSNEDLRTLKKIASFEDARNKTPIILLVYNCPGDWKIKTWCGTPRRLFRIFGDIRYERLEIKLY